jgi:hypothetical protein
MIRKHAHLVMEAKHFLDGNNAAVPACLVHGAESPGAAGYELTSSTLIEAQTRCIRSLPRRPVLFLRSRGTAP